MYLYVSGIKPGKWVVMYLYVSGIKPGKWVVMYLCVMGIGFVSFYWLAIKCSSNYSCFLDSVVHVFVFVVTT
jgi:hypothetical protein